MRHSDASPLLCLLGTPHLRQGPHRLDLPSNVPAFMLAYLAVRAGWITRDALMSVFWPERPETEAQHNLRVNLHRVKRLLGSWGLTHRLGSEWRRVRIDLETDVHRFRAAVGRADWAEAVTLHGGPLMSGLALAGFAAVDEWVVSERAALADAWRHAALREAERRTAAGDGAGAFALLQAQLSADVLAEDSVQALLRVAAAAGERDAALRLFGRFRERLQSELGLSPMALTEQLAHALREPGLATQQLAPRQAALPARLSAPPLTGREAERLRLEQAREPLVLVVGEPGIGKTRLLEETLPNAVWLRCREDQRGRALHPVRETLDDLSAAVEALPVFARHRGWLLHLLPSLAGDETLEALDPAGAQRLSAAAAAVLRALERPLVVDDLQWVDEATLSVLTDLARSGGVRIRASIRRDEIGDDLAIWIDARRAEGLSTSIELGPLDADGILSLVGALSGAAQGPSRFASWLHRRTGGNPFFALETLRALFDTGRLRVDGGRWSSDLDAVTLDYAELEIPPQVLDVVRRRLNRLTESTRRALTIGCVAGNARLLEPLAAVAGLSPWGMAEAVSEAQQAGLLRGREFAHDLLRQALYQATPEALRSVLHAGIARHCGDLLPPHRLAEHWWAAGQPEAAVAATLRAASQDRAMGQQQAADRLLSEALDRTELPADRAALLLARGRTALEMNRPDAAAALATEALATLPRPEDRVGLLVLQGDLALQSGRLEQALRHQIEAAAIEPGRADVSMLQARIAFDRGLFAAGVECLQALLESRRRLPPDGALVDTLSALGAALDALGETERALAAHREALATARRLGARHAQVDVAVNLLWSLSEAGRFEEALAVGNDALALGHYGGTPSLMNNLAWLLLELGRIGDAEALYRSLLGEPDPTLHCFARAKLVEIAARGADPAATKAAIAAALQALAGTDVYRAHAAVVIAVLEHGEASDVPRAAAWLREQPLDPFMEGRIDALRRRHGLVATTDRAG